MFVLKEVGHRGTLPSGDLLLRLHFLGVEDLRQVGWRLTNQRPLLLCHYSPPRPPNTPCFCVQEQINPVSAPVFVKHYLLLLYGQQRDSNLSQINEPRSSVITAYCSNQAGFERRGTLSFGQLIKITRKRGSPIILGLLKWGLISAPLSPAGTPAFVSTTGARWQNKAFCLECLQKDLKRQSH